MARDDPADPRPAPGGPGLAFASGSLWVANTEQRQVARAALDTDATPITVDASPIALAASPDAVGVAAGPRTAGWWPASTRSPTRST
jgi:hypothetical protein